MEKNSLTYIRSCLDSLKPIYPLVAGDAESQYGFCPGIKAVIFDIYGTLLVSDSGDFRQEKLSETRLSALLGKSVLHIKDENKNRAVHEIIGKYNDYIKKHHGESKSSGIEYPEINIVDLWDSVISGLAADNLLETPLPDIDLKLIAIVFELSLNPIYPMPFMTELIRLIESKPLISGVVSNAQFYTPLIMNYFLDNEISFSEHIKAFKDDLNIFSYKFGMSKPGVELFETAVSRLSNNYNIRPEETIFIGNDMLNDIYPAKSAGFKTVLFTGDARSLRRRKEHPLVNSLKADYVIRDLKELPHIIGI
ncbi:MAG: Haloacid dehalogenase domain protein hydrolase [Candidatus Uhrbacteria bacterium GW2011_GWF2_39_13]|uniref:Haloacid dehalogenase domain protein hydrolase n=1 Tax=Candidatus Uhrbacteria bacterium GW2011_GWF2_39_13 TaxID=1618995 RepID=A0A0G0MKF2_9BACT|nr:MAG: Haloacid dehalogenase domain protein hydrolase [Candidatus Uhrbacteria bacterium GW2011_GWF2_39_13]